jgi:hypothetical protein
MEAATEADRRRRVLLLRVGGFTALALGFLGSIACFVAALVAIVNALGQFHRIDVPATRVLTLQQRHYVVYYEVLTAVSEPLDPQGLSVVVRPLTGTPGPVPISQYGSSFTYTRGNYSGQAALTFDAPRAGTYAITTADPNAQGGAQIVVGPSVLELVTHDLIPGVLGSIIVFFGVGGIGALLLTLSDRRPAG